MEKCEELLPQVPELASVMRVVAYTDSLPGEASRATAQGISRLDLAMRLIEIDLAKNPQHAADRWLAWARPDPSTDNFLRGETFSYRAYFRTALTIYDLLHAKTGPLQANFFLARVLDQVQSQEALSDLHENLATRMREGVLSAGFLRLYLNKPSLIQPTTQPQLTNWNRVVFFWKLLLDQKSAAAKGDLLMAIQVYLAKTSEAPPLAVRFLVDVGDGETRRWGDFWPMAARERWDQIMAKVSFSDTDRKSLDQIREIFQKAEERSPGRFREVAMTKYWARPESRRLLLRAVELQKSYSQLQRIGAWEPRLGSLLADLKNHITDEANSEERMLNFFEKIRILELFLSLSGYDRSLEVNDNNSAAIREQLAIRHPHFARQQIVSELLALLESEEGRWIYQQRRLIWLGVLLNLVREVESSLPQLAASLRERASVSSHEVIRLYVAARLPAN